MTSGKSSVLLVRVGRTASALVFSAVFLLVVLYAGSVMAAPGDYTVIVCRGAGAGLQAEAAYTGVCEAFGGERLAPLTVADVVAGDFLQTNAGWFSPDYLLANDGDGFGDDLCLWNGDASECQGTGFSNMGWVDDGEPPDDDPPDDDDPPPVDGEFDVSQLDPSEIAKAWGAGFTMMGISIVIGFGFREILDMIRKG